MLEKYLNQCFTLDCAEYPECVDTESVHIRHIVDRVQLAAHPHGPCQHVLGVPGLLWHGNYLSTP